MVSNSPIGSGAEPEYVSSEKLFRRHAEFVASFLYRIGAHRNEIDDLVQDVFLLAHRKGGYRAGAASPTTFLARLALEARLAKRRRDSRWRKAQCDELALTTTGDAPDDPSCALALKHAAARLQAALDAIEPSNRALLILFELHGESCEAIAEAFDLKLGTVYSRLHAGRKVFRAALAQGAQHDQPPEWCRQETV